MIESDPPHVPEGLRHAQDREKGRAARLRVRVGDRSYPILSYDETGFELRRIDAAALRGRVEIHDGPRLLRTVLVVAAEPSRDAIRYEYKRRTEARATPPLDYVRGEAGPGGIG